jgi:hypothetical protein
MTRRQFPRISKSARLLIGTISILFLYLAVHLASAHLSPTHAGEPEIGDNLNSLSPTTAPERGIGWEITSRSGSAEIDLAKYLTQKDVKVYGAYWCPHCYEQEQLFGKQAWKSINHIECAADAKVNPQPAVCEQAGIKGYPTWAIDGKLAAGVKKLAQLAELTDYQGNKNFRYDRLLDKAE